jgi:uncharacterized membrane protein required for colicin V production
MNLDTLPVNAFDLGLVLVLAVGIARGRKHGMSEELLGLIKWLALLFGCAFIYEPAGKLIAQSSPFSLLSSYLMAYAGGALVILVLFALVKRTLGGKLVGSDIFGRSEYYLGMGSGLMRFACMLLIGLAVLNARYFSPMEVRAREKAQNEVLGSNFFPGLQSVQSVVFDKSLAGPWIKEHLDFLLIKPTEPENKEFHQREAVLP